MNLRRVIGPFTIGCDCPVCWPRRCTVWTLLGWSLYAACGWSLRQHRPGLAWVAFVVAFVANKRGVVIFGRGVGLPV